MGKYLQAGICVSIKIGKNDLNIRNINYEELLEGLSKEIYIEAYNQVEFENSYGFILKDEIIQEGQLSEFLKEQYDLIVQKNGDEDEIIELMKKQTTVHEIEQLLEKKSFYSFHNTDIYGGLYCTKWRHYIRAEYSLFTYLSEGKIVMECYNNFLKYIEKNIKMNSKNPIGDVVKVMIG